MNTFLTSSPDDHCFSLIRREALFDSDACGQKLKIRRIHVTAMACGSIEVVPLPQPQFPMQLIFAIPDIYCSTGRFC